MAYPLPYKFTDWIGFKKDCPDHSGVMTTDTFALSPPGILWIGWSPSAGSSTNTSIAKTLIGGAQTSGSAVVTGLYLDSSSSVPPGANNIIFRLNNGDSSNANPPNDWNRLIYEWTTSGVTYTQVFYRSNAALTRLAGAYTVDDWVWFWQNPRSPSSIPQWSPPQNNKSVTWTVTQSTA